MSKNSFVAEITFELYGVEFHGNKIIVGEAKAAFENLQQ